MKGVAAIFGVSKAPRAPAGFVRGTRVVAVICGCCLLSIRLAGAQGEPPPILSGVWSATTTTFDNPAWHIEDLFSCACTSETYEHIRQLLNDPVNDHLSAEELQRIVRAHNAQVISDRLTEAGRERRLGYDHADDPAIQCEPFGAFRSMLHSDPVRIERYEDRFVIRAEDLASDRTIYMDGRDHPADGRTTVTGHSIGWYEGPTLVVETVGVSANLADDQLSIHNTDQARIIERYTVSEDGGRLDMTFILHDPVMFQQPLTLERARILTPDVELQEAPCEAISGQP